MVELTMRDAETARMAEAAADAMFPGSRGEAWLIARRAYAAGVEAGASQVARGLGRRLLSLSGDGRLRVVVGCAESEV